MPKQSIPLPPTWHQKDLSTVPPVQSQFMVEDHGRVIAHAAAPAWERYRELYREKVHLYDREVGEVLKALQASGCWSNTLVVATSDHGDMDTHHRLIFKGPFMYDHMVRVPLMIRLPDQQAPGQPARTLDHLTVNVDLAPTLAEFAGIALPVTDGRSLKSLLTGEATNLQRDFVVSQYYSKQNWVNPIRMIRTKQYKYNLYRGHGEELYHLVSDPMELRNLSDDPHHAAAKQDLAAALNQWISDHGDPFYTQHPTTRRGKMLPI